MSTTLGTMGAGYNKVYTDYIYKETALPDTTNATTTAFKIGDNNHRVQLVLTAATEIVIASTETITIELLQAPTETGTYNVTKTLAVIPASTIANGATILKYVPEDGIKHWGKIKITATDDQSAGKITGYLTQIV